MKKILIALIVILALSVSVLAGCNLGIMSIELKSGSFADEYYVGDTVSLSNAKIVVTKSDGTTENVNVTADMLNEQITTNTVGEKEYTITYQGKTTTFKINVVNPTLSLVPNTVNYYVGDTVNLSAITVTVTKGQQSSNVTLTQEMLGSKTISTETAGNFTFEVSYQGAKVNLTVNVVAPTIAIDNESAYKTVYFVGETVDLTNVKLVVTKGTSTTKVAVTEAMVEGATTPLAKGSKTFTVKYLGATTTFTVEARKVESISLQNASLELIVGQPVPYADIKVVVKYEDIEQTETISATEAMFGDTKINTSALTEQAVNYTITYQGKTATLSVSVINPAVDSISVKTIKNVYYIGDAADLTNAVLTVNFEGDTPSRDIPITAEMFGANPIDTSAVASNVEYTISFGGKTTSTTISVKDIAIVIGQFTVSYNQLDEVNTEATIKVVDAADNTVVLATIPVTAAMLDKPVSTSVAGETTYTITYTKNANVVRTVNVAVNVKAMVLEVEGLKLSYEYNETVSYTGSLKVKYQGSNEIVRTVPITESMFGANKISTTKVGDTVYTITYLDAVTVNVTIHVNPEKKPSVTTFEMPQFIQDYNTKSAAEDISDANFKVNNVVYEVGNANKFIVEPIVRGKDIDGSNLSLDKGVHTIATFRVSDTLNGEYNLVADLSNLVTVSGNAYQFEQNANGKYVEMTVSLDPNYYDFDENITSSRTIKFVVIDNGYNVYDQAGLAAINDYVYKPEIWADILGCNVVNGQYVAGDNVLTLEADSKPLYQYIGTIDWIILHGNIVINPDNLPSAYFWNGSEVMDGEGATAGSEFANVYNNILNVATDKENVVAPRRAQLLGSLRDRQGSSGTYCNYLVSNNVNDDNNNKSLYSTSKVNISGNYNAITVKDIGDKTYTVTNSTAQFNGQTYQRRLIGVAHHTVQEADRSQEVGNQWHLFSLLEPASDNGDGTYSWVEAPVTSFTIKNIAMTGNTGHVENLVSAGMEMLHFYAYEIKLENVVANKFHVNLSQDNYSAGAYDNIIEITNTKIYDTFNSMAFTWRGVIRITNSLMKDCGGPLFILCDGNGGSPDNPIMPTLTVDSSSELEAYAQGTEAWYKELNSAASDLFTQLAALNEGLFKTIFHKSFQNDYADEHHPNGKYISVLAIIIPENGQAFGDKGNNYVNIERKHNVRGKYTVTSASGNVSYDMLNPYILGMKQAAYGTLFFQSGDNYAMYIPPEMGGPTLANASGNPFITTDPMNNNSAEMLQWAGSWAQSPDTLCVWLKNPADEDAPYLGVIIGGFRSVA